MSAPGTATPEEAALREHYAEQLSPAWFDAHHATGEALAQVARRGSAQPAVDGVADRKTFATAQARLALAGFQLERMADGSFVVARWTMTASLATMVDVEKFMSRVGAA